MKKILISTNMYKGSEFGQILPYLKRFSDRWESRCSRCFMRNALRRTCGTPCRS